MSRRKLTGDERESIFWLLVILVAFIGIFIQDGLLAGALHIVCLVIVISLFSWLARKVRGRR